MADRIRVKESENFGVYTLKEYEEGVGVCFEEGVIGYNDDGVELAVSISIVKEIQPPEECDLSNLMEEVNQKELFQV